MVKTCPPNQENCDKILSKLSSIENRLQLIENETPLSQTVNEPNVSLNTYKKCQQAYYEHSPIERLDDDDDEE